MLLLYGLSGNSKMCESQRRGGVEGGVVFGKVSQRLILLFLIYTVSNSLLK
jgi:hypothetical protein